MDGASTPSRIAERIAQAGLTVPDATLALLASYLELLARWNERINLTALTLTPPTDEAIDRLLIEPTAAAAKIRPTDQLLIDLGSGGGSPGIPIIIAAPWLSVVLVESKTRKCAFLREAARQLGLKSLGVENCRIESIATRGTFRAVADIVTLRAVRADHGIWSAVEALLKPRGRALWFTTMTAAEAGQMLGNLTIDVTEQLVPGSPGRLVVLVKTR